MRNQASTDLNILEGLGLVGTTNTEGPISIHNIGGTDIGNINQGGPVLGNIGGADIGNINLGGPGLSNVGLKPDFSYNPLPTKCTFGDHQTWCREKLTDYERINDCSRHLGDNLCVVNTTEHCNDREINKRCDEWHEDTPKEPYCPVFRVIKKGEKLQKGEHDATWPEVQSDEKQWKRLLDNPFDRNKIVRVENGTIDGPGYDFKTRKWDSRVRKGAIGHELVSKKKPGNCVISRRKKCKETLKDLFCSNETLIDIGNLGLTVRH